jgi:hypothetical protein
LEAPALSFGPGVGIGVGEGLAFPGLATDGAIALGIGGFVPPPRGGSADGAIEGMLGGAGLGAKVGAFPPKEGGGVGLVDPGFTGGGAAGRPGAVGEAAGTGAT